MDEVDRQAIVRVKQQLAHLFTPNPWIYWTDMLVSAAVGWSAFALAWQLLAADAPSVLPVAACLFVAVFALYRVLAFTHELEHLPAGALPGFRAVWHVLCGMPLCLPHFIYRGVHRIHHSTRYYGTPEDPEYIRFVANGSFREPLTFLALAMIFPLVVTFRYLVLTPLALLSPRLRSWVDRNASSFVMKLDYARQVATGPELKAWRIEEYSTTLFVWTVVGLVCAGVVPVLVLPLWLAVLGGIMFSNAVRALAATHVYASRGEVLPFDEHIADSVNLQRFSILNLLVAPVGLTFHATHHVFPGLPYYALARAHRLLAQAGQGEGTPLGFYRRSQHATLPRSIANLVRLTRAASSAVHRPPEKPARDAIAPERVEGVEI